jgi:putative protein kinase ArgK-like GTPase of G3E family
LIEKYKMPYYAISAKSGQGIDELFFRIAEMLEVQEAEKHRKLKQTYCEEYDHPPATFESLTRSQTKDNAIAEDDKEKLTLTSGATHTRCHC